MFQVFSVLLVGVPGFEPGASWTRTMRDTKLRHTPMQALLYHGHKKSQVKNRHSPPAEIALRTCSSSRLPLPPWHLIDILQDTLISG